MASTSRRALSDEDALAAYSELGEEDVGQPLSSDSADDSDHDEVSTRVMDEPCFMDSGLLELEPQSEPEGDDEPAAPPLPAPETPLAPSTAPVVAQSAAPPPPAPAVPPLPPATCASPLQVPLAAPPAPAATAAPPPSPPAANAPRKRGRPRKALLQPAATPLAPSTAPVVAQSAAPPPPAPAVPPLPPAAGASPLQVPLAAPPAPAATAAPPPSPLAANAPRKRGRLRKALLQPAATPLPPAAAPRRGPRRPQPAQPASPKRPRGHPSAPRQPAIPPPPHQRPATPPPDVTPAAMRDFRARSAGRVDQAKRLRGAEREAVLVEEERDRAAHTGEWTWDDCPENEPFMNTDILFQEPLSRLSPRARGAKTELDFFNLFLSADDWEKIVHQSNLYRNQQGLGFQALTRSSIQGYIGLTIAMGLVHKTRLQRYWSTDEVVDTPFFPKVMARNRYQEHQRCLHLVNNNQVAKSADGKPLDKLYKVRPLLDNLVKAFHRHYSPGRELSIDEMMLGTKCRLGFIQHMKDKPTKWGIKLWTLCDAKVHYCLNIDVYTGGDGEVGLGFRVVNQLMSQYLEKGHRLYIDNFYTSPDLLVHLLDHRTLAVGTVRNNRKHMPARLKPGNAEVEVGESRFLQSHGMTACRWKDKRDVFMLSTVHGESLTEVTRRREREGRVEDEVVQKPTAVCDYNAYMGGVDIFDQLLSYHPIVRRYKRSWLKIFWRLIDIAILNAFALWKLKYLSGELPMTSPELHYKFRLELARRLVAPQLEERAGVPRPTYIVQRNPLRHHGDPVRHGLQKRCVVCRNPSRTNWGCRFCDDHVRVHIQVCSHILHTRANPDRYYQDNVAP